MDTILSRGIAWATDIHLEFADRPIFYDKVKRNPAKSIVLTGDIGNAIDTRYFLTSIASLKRVFFVLGNHDYYRGSIEEVRGDIYRNPIHNATFLTTQTTPVEIAENEFLVGVDGWADARFGNERSSVRLNDWLLIEEMRRHQSQLGYPPIKFMRRMADEDAGRLARVLEQCDGAKRVIIATHVPPFRHSAWHEGKPSDDEWTPFFVSKATGDEITRYARRNPSTRVVVLCGHSHGFGVLSTENITTYTGGAEYGNPQIQTVEFLSDS